MLYQNIQKLNLHDSINLIYDRKNEKYALFRLIPDEIPEIVSDFFDEILLPPSKSWFIGITYGTTKLDSEFHIFAPYEQRYIELTWFNNLWHHKENKLDHLYGINPIPHIGLGDLFKLIPITTLLNLADEEDLDIDSRLYKNIYCFVLELEKYNQLVLFNINDGKGHSFKISKDVKYLHLVYDANEHIHKLKLLNEKKEEVDAINLSKTFDKLYKI